ncbi:hypothetical protein PS918_01191 [Pseudomonas fluorescens]|uniref:Uncharacterized protein n=1 Tax=Pseudomonas fluorescens TaxID=294 RepID=A0A5E7RAN9_PSEFL|nr:hypothetical protein PS918_01191 [Pseudomonas fluorescens]
MAPIRRNRLVSILEQLKQQISVGSGLERIEPQR